MKIRWFLLGIGIMFWLHIPLSRGLETDSLFYYLLPPKGKLIIQDTSVSNEMAAEGRMIFQQEEGELIKAEKGVSGLKIVGKNFEAEIKPETEVKVGTPLELIKGSLHISTLAKNTEEANIRFGKLILSFQAADFLLFVNGEQTEKVIKVLEGAVNIENPETKQKATLQAEQATSADKDDLLLIPYSYDISSQETWWESKQYDYVIELLPMAHAGEDQEVLGNILVVLDGSKSQYQTGDIFEWTLKKGPRDEKGKEITEVAFDSTNIVKPLFVPSVDGEYYFSLEITNEKGEKSNQDEVVIFVGRQYLQPIRIFSDVPTTHPNNLAITYFYKKKVMTGSRDQKTGELLFRPSDFLNRVEILKTLFENSRQKIPSQEEMKQTKDGLFLDVKPDHWFAPYVFLGKKLGIIKGNNGLYRPADKVLMVEALKMILESYQIPLEAFQNKKEIPYPDSEANAWYIPYLLFVKEYNLFDPDENGNMNPSKPLSRAQFAEILYRMESINLLEKRAYLSGKLKSSKTGKGIPQGEIYISLAIEKTSSTGSKTSTFVEKGDLYYKTITQKDGSFSVSLPIHTKYYIEAVSGENISSNRVVTEVFEGKVTKVELEIEESP